MKMITRREFCTHLTIGLSGVLMCNCVRKRESHRKPVEIKSHIQTGQNRKLKILKYNPLGKTGIMVSDIVFGAGFIYAPEVIRYAFDLGINLFDTSEGYTSGVSEDIIGQGLTGVRDKAYIITKLGFSSRRKVSEASITKRLETSLKKLDTDYVDGLFIHSMDTMDSLNNEVICNAYYKFKKDGKVRFTGFSTHKEAYTLAECIKPEYEDFVDVVMFRYNHEEGPGIEPLVASLRQKGIGTIAMKTLATDNHGILEKYIDTDTTYSQAAIQWVLSKPYIDCAVLTMNTYALVDEYVAVSGKALKG